MEDRHSFSPRSYENMGGPGYDTHNRHSSGFHATGSYGSNFGGTMNTMGYHPSMNGFNSGIGSPAMESMLSNPNIMNAAGDMQRQFIHMVDERIREAFKCYFSTEEMPKFIKKGIKHIFHGEGIEHLGRAKKDMRHDYEKDEYEDDEDDEEEEHYKLGRVYAKLIEKHHGLGQLPESARFAKLKECYPKLSNRMLSQLCQMLGQPHLGKLLEQDGMSLKEFCREIEG